MQNVQKCFLILLKLTNSPIRMNKKNFKWKYDQITDVAVSTYNARKYWNNCFYFYFFYSPNKQTTLPQSSIHNTQLFSDCRLKLFCSLLQQKRELLLPIFSSVAFLLNEKISGSALCFLPVPSPLRVWTVSRQFIDPKVFKDKAEKKNTCYFPDYRATKTVYFLTTF